MDPTFRQDGSVHLPTNQLMMFVPSSTHALPLLQTLISIETVKVLRERMSDCYRREGVNHLENCKSFVAEYTKAIWDIKRANAPAIGQ